MSITLFVAMDQKGGIGLKSGTPWQLRGPDALFTNESMGKYVIVGRKTWESMKASLIGRKVLVMSRDPNYISRKNVAGILHSMEDVRLYMEALPAEYMVYGGEGIFRLFLPIATEAYVTSILGIHDCDTFLPIDTFESWKFQSSQGGHEGEYIFHIDHLTR